MKLTAETFHCMPSPKVRAYISILQQTLLCFNECGASHPNAQYSHGASEVKMVTLTQFCSRKSEFFLFFFGENIKDNLETLDALTINWPCAAFVPFLFLVVIVLVANAAITEGMQCSGNGNKVLCSRVPFICLFLRKHHIK